MFSLIKSLVLQKSNGKNKVAKKENPTQKKMKEKQKVRMREIPIQKWSHEDNIHLLEYAKRSLASFEVLFSFFAAVSERIT